MAQLQGLSWNRLGLGPLPSLARLTALTFEEGMLGRNTALPSLVRLTDLRRLALDDCWDNGLSTASSKALSFLPGALSRLTSLEHLVIRGVGLNSDHLIRILPGLISLQHLDLSNNDIRNGNAIFSPVLATLTALTHLDLSSNHMWEDRGEDLIEHHSISSIASTLTSFTGLLYLDLSHNNHLQPLGAAAVAALGNSLPASLQWLSLNSNGFSAAGLMALTPGLRRLAALEHLGLSRYIVQTDSAQARKDSLQALAGCLQCMPCLKGLDLSVNEFGPGTEQALADCLQHVPALRGLELDFTRLGVHGAQHLAGCLHHMPALRSLGLRGNGFGDDGVAALLDGLLALSSLTNIGICGNSVSEAVNTILSVAFNRLGRIPPACMY